MLFRGYGPSGGGLLTFLINNVASDTARDHGFIYMQFLCQCCFVVIASIMELLVEFGRVVSTILLQTSLHVSDLYYAIYVPMLLRSGAYAAWAYDGLLAFHVRYDVSSTSTDFGLS